MASLQFVKLNLDMIALNIQSLENTSDRNEALDMLTHVAQALEKSNQMETVFQNHKNQPLTSANGVTPQIPTWSHKQRASEKIALQEEKFKCGQCGKCFPSQSKLKRHTSSQGGCALRRYGPEESKNVHCPECGFRTNTVNNLKSHQIKHSDRFKCTVQCGRGFSGPQDLEKHQKNPKNCLKYMTQENSSF